MKNYEEWKDGNKNRGVREENWHSLDGNVRREGGRDVWFCESCGERILKDVNGEAARAMMTVVGGSSIFVKFKELAAICRCGTMNYLGLDGYTDIIEDDPKAEHRERTFTEEWMRVEEKKISRAAGKDAAPDYMLGFK